MGIENRSEIGLVPNFKRGRRNLITDVKGVTVGHSTIISEDHTVNTGVTVIRPSQGNIFRNKMLAGASVINGFGKTAGLVQIQELGTLESPIYLTNTLSVGTVLTAAVKQSLAENPEIGVTTGTVNCLVCECNDGPMNDIRGLHVTEDHVKEAYDSAAEDFEEGPVGAGTGMKMMGLKGGIGSASRLFTIADKEYTIGALVLTNYGTTRTLTMAGDPIGRRIASDGVQDKGSCILIIATDAPLSSRQLTRTANRAAHALARTGSFSGNGSGDIAVAFSTANRVEQFPASPVSNYAFLHDDYISEVFEAGVEAMEEALLSSLCHGRTMEGIRGRVLKSINDYL